MSVPLVARDQRETTFGHDLDEMHEALHRLTEHSSPNPVHPPAITLTSPVVDLLAGGALEPGDPVEDTVEYQF